MKLEDQVVSLELAMKLKELGVKQDSLFCYEVCDHEKKHEVIWFNDSELLPDSWEKYSAFTVAELGSMLPHKIKNKYIMFSKDETGFNINYKDCNNHISYFCHFDKIEANTRAKMLIYILENKLMNIEG